MRLKVFGLFLAVQLLSIGLWYTLNQADANDFQASAAAPETELNEPISSKSLPESQAPPQPSSCPPLEASFCVQAPVGDKPLEPYKITIRNWDQAYQSVYEQQVDMIQKVMQILPTEHSENLEIVLDYDPTAHRGWGGKGIVILGATNMPDSELIAVLIHEVGHHVDASFLQSTDEKFPSAYHDGKKVLYNNDPSVAFYNLSWLSDDERRLEDSQSDSTSGYGASNPHEDFAETYAFYTLHRAEFESLSQNNSVLKQKYDFMRNVVFRGKEFEDSLTFPTLQEKRPWDITKLPYDLSLFLQMNGG